VGDPKPDETAALKKMLAMERKLRLANDLPEAVARLLPDPIFSADGWDVAADERLLAAAKAIRDLRGTTSQAGEQGAPHLQYGGQPMNDALVDKVRREQPAVYATKAFQDALWQYKLAKRRGYGRG